MKLLGFLLIVSSSAVCAHCYLRERAAQLQCMQSLCFMLNLMQCELSDKQCPLADLFAALEYKCSGKAAAFLSMLNEGMNNLGRMDMCSIWCLCVESKLNELNRDEQEMLRELGAVLGKYDCRTQSEKISLCRSFLMEKCERTQQLLPQSRRNTVGISLSAGALLAILLV